VSSFVSTRRAGAERTLDVLGGVNSQRSGAIRGYRNVQQGADKRHVDAGDVERGKSPSMSPTPMPMSMRPSIFASAAASGTPTVNGNGLAQCNGFVGIVTIEATAPANPSTPLSQMNSMMSLVTGQANMTCS
jgi:hypothetical protein